jgi:hypothetical protein
VPECNVEVPSTAAAVRTVGAIAVGVDDVVTTTLVPVAVADTGSAPFTTATAFPPADSTTAAAAADSAVAVKTAASAACNKS